MAEKKSIFRRFGITGKHPAVDRDVPPSFTKTTTPNGDMEVI